MQGGLETNPAVLLQHHQARGIMDHGIISNMHGIDIYVFHPHSGAKVGYLAEEKTQNTKQFCGRKQVVSNLKEFAILVAV